MAHELPEGQALSFDDFKATVENLQASTITTHTELEAKKVEVAESQKVVTGLANAALGERSVIARLCEQQAEIMNPLFKAGQVQLKAMIDQAFLIAGGMQLRGHERLPADREAVERILPQLQTAGTKYAVFSDTLAFHTATGPAYLQTGPNVVVKVPVEPTKYYDSWTLPPTTVEVEPSAIIDRYTIYQAAMLEDLSGERIEYGGRRYRSEQGPIRCAEAGRVMAGQEFAQENEEVQALVQAAQGPLRQYFDDMMPQLLAGSFRADTSETRELLSAIDEAKHLNADKVQEVIDALVDMASNSKLDRIDQTVNLLAVVLERKNGIPDRGSVLDSIERRARATLEAIALVKVA